MPKKLRDEPIYVAPNILAWRDDAYRLRAFDERNNKDLNPDCIEDKIYIYERQVQDWFLKRAVSLIRRKQNDFVAMMIAVAYIEGVEQYRNGVPSNGNSKSTFRSGFKRIFDMSESETDNIDKLYKHLRCGLFHNGMSGDMVVFNRKLKKAVVFSARGTIDINPRLFVAAISNDYASYLRELRDPCNEELRMKFDSMFNVT